MCKIFFFLCLSIVLCAVYSIVKAQKIVWRNWGRNQRCTPQALLYPKTLSELQAVLKKAVAENKKVHVAGSGHSWSDLVCTADYLISIDKLDRVLSIDTQKKLIKVEAGITFDKLNKALTQAGLALSNQSAILAQTVAGATATATHGTGHTGTLASFIKELELVTADGRVHKLSHDTTPELFAAARVSLGSLGIVYTVVLQCESLFKVVSRSVETNFSQVLSNYRQWYKENDYFMFRWNPYSDRVSLEMANKIAQINQVDQDNKENKQESRGNYLYEVFSSTATGGKRMEEEIAIPLALLPEVLKELKPLLMRYKRKNLSILGDVLCRFVCSEHNVYLSPAVGRDTVYISISTAGWKNYKEFYKEFEDLLLKYQGRPHWGKINFLNYARAQRLYGDNLDKFIAIRSKLDPNNTFSNAFTGRVFTREKNE